MSNIQPLNVNFDLSNVKTAIPLIADGHIVQARLKSIEQEQTDKGATLKWTYETTEPAPTKDGSEAAPGFPIFERIQLYAREGAKNPTWFLEKIARRMDALLDTGDEGNAKGKPARPAFGPETVAQMIGRPVALKMSISSYEGNERNEIDKAYSLSDLGA
jgi:hypothetical protein